MKKTMVLTLLACFWMFNLTSEDVKSQRGGDGGPKLVSGGGGGPKFYEPEESMPLRNHRGGDGGPGLASIGEGNPKFYGHECEDNYNSTLKDTSSGSQLIAPLNAIVSAGGGNPKKGINFNRGDSGSSPSFLYI